MVTARDIYGQTALHHAVLNKNLMVLSQLVAKGVSEKTRILADF